MKVSKWIYFDSIPVDTDRKTSMWGIHTRAAGNLLGIVKWYGAWRCYAFYPNTATLYEKQCLRDIADFCEEQTEAHRKQKAKANAKA